MEMLIPGMAVAQQASAVSGTVAARTGTGAGAEGSFKQALVQQIVGDSSQSADVQTKQSGLMAVITPQNAVMSLNGSETTVTTEDLLSLVDGLMDNLDSLPEGESVDKNSMLDQLQSMLYALQALLTLLGIPAARTPNIALEAEQSGAMSQVDLAMLQAKTSLQDGLIQLQALLQHGSLKQVQGQEPLAFISNQLQSLAAVLTSEGSSQEPKTLKSEASALPSWVNAQSAASKDASVLLQRLSQQAVHPSALSAAMIALSDEGQLVQTQADNQAGAIIEQPVSVQLPFVGPNNIRDFAPLLAKSAAPTAFVLADNFADTMNGLIVQKFDIRAVDGLTEAKLKLFPEQLGQVDVRISMQNGVLTALFQTDTSKAKDMLENQMAQLRAALQAQGLNVEKLEVTQSPASMELSQQPGGQEQRGKQASDNRNGFGDDENVTDNAFESEMAEQAAIQGLGYGRAINETA